MSPQALNQKRLKELEFSFSQRITSMTNRIHVGTSKSMKQPRLDLHFQDSLKYLVWSIPSKPHLVVYAPSPQIQNHPSSME